MSTPIIVSTVLITLALVFYSLGVWSEKIAHYLKPWHVIAFWIGFAFDVSGTLAMHYISDKPFNILEPHTLTGQIAIWLMLFHAAWATRVIFRNDEKLKNNFHRFSLFVWLVWLVPYLGGMYLGMIR
jgi:uncharacterized repeat protein (TIGR03987 family)